MSPDKGLVQQMRNKQTNKNIGHPVVTERDGTTAVLLYGLMMNWSSGAILLVALIFGVLPSAAISAGPIGHFIDWSLAHWPKLASDFLKLTELNPDLRYIYAGFNIVSATITIMSLIFVGIPLALTLARRHQSLDEFHTLPRRHFLAIFALCFLVWWIFFFPTQFRTVGTIVSSEYPTSIIALVYSGLMWIGLQIFLTNVLTRISKLIFGR